MSLNDSYSPDQVITSARKKRFLLGCLVVFALFVTGAFLTISFLFHLSPQTLWQLARGQVSETQKKLTRTNFLLLGAGGGTHDGADLTDTMMIASVDFEKKHIAFISIPRDLWIEEFKDKINAAYHIGEEKNPGQGLSFVKTTVSNITGVPLQYAGLINFEGFQNMINTLGGLDVDVSDSFTDAQYPITGKENDLCSGDKTFACRYETVTFTKGIEHMNGERALKYVRSRHAEGDAGNDFSRSARQQAVLTSLKNKMLSPAVLSNLTLMQKFIDTLKQATITDVPFSEGLLMGRVLLASKPEIRSTVLVQDEPEKKIKGLLIHPPLKDYDGHWVLIPKAEDFEKIKAYVKCFIENITECTSLID